MKEALIAMLIKIFGRATLLLKISARLAGTKNRFHIEQDTKVEVSANTASKPLYLSIS